MVPRTLSSESLRRRGAARRRATRGQELVEFTILITFFLIIFFCTLEVCWVAIQKFQLNHYAFVTARSWSAGPNGGMQNGALFWVKQGEKKKKDAFGITLSRNDGIRRNEMSIPLVTLPFDKPTWARLPYGNYDGLLIKSKIPVIMPYAEMVMGQTPRVYGHKYIEAKAFVPMEKEPKDEKSDEYDNNGVAWNMLPWPIEPSKVNIQWVQMQTPNL